MQIEVTLEGFRWRRWPGVVGRTEFRAGGTQEPYVVPHGVAEHCQELDPEDPAAVKVFLERFGPLTRQQRADGKVRLEDFQRAHSWILAGRGAQLVSDPDGLAFHPWSLRDFLTLAARSVASTDTCAYPGCDRLVGKAAGHDPRETACDEHKPAMKTRRHQAVKKAFKQEFGDSWKDDWEFAKRLKGRGKYRWYLNNYDRPPGPPRVGSPDDFEVLTDTANEVTTNE